MQAPPYYQPTLPRAKRTTCLKPLVGCTVGPLLAVGLVLGCALACLSSFTLQGPNPPLGQDYEPNPTEAVLYEQSIASSLQQSVAFNGTFTIQIEDRTLSSWLNTNYETLFEDYDIPQPFLWDQSEPQFQIHFDDDRIFFYVENEVPFVTLNAMLTASVSPPNTDLTAYLIDVDIIRIESMGIDVEDDSVTISAWVIELITDQVEAYRVEAGLGEIVISEVSAQDGILTLRGQVATN